MARFLTATALATSVSLLLAGSPRADGGSYVLDGGTPTEQAQVRQALDASAFDWSVVPAETVIHIRRGLATSFSLPGQIWLDADLLDAGRFSWGVVQMEYAHQVHFFLLDEQTRTQLTAALGAKDWCYQRRGVAPVDEGCERFAATLAWAYWPSAANALKPSSPRDWSAALPPAGFRALLARVLAREVPSQRTLTLSPEHEV